MGYWLRIASMGLLWAIATSCDARGALSQIAFRDAVAQEITSQRPDLCVRVEGEAGLNVGRSRDACDEIQVSTAYIYQQYASDPANQSLYIGRLATMALEGLSELEGAPFTPDRNRLVAVLRPNAYTASSGAAGDPGSSIWRPFAGDFVVMLAEYDNGRMRSIRGVDLQRIDLSELQAWDVAIANLRQQIGPLERAPNAAGAELVTARSGLAPASLILPETCAASGPDFDVFVVARDSFFYADTQNPEATIMLAGYAGQLVQASEVYSHRLLSCLDGAWYASVFNGANAWLPEQPSH